MSAPTSTLGTCPDCETTIPSARLLIEYERDGGTGRYAECPGCLDVVAPE